MASKRNSRPITDRKPNPDDISAARAASPRQFVTWTPALVRQAIRQAESGNLTMAASCCAWLMQDSRIVGTLQARVDQLMGLPVQFQNPDKKNPKAIIIEDLADDFSEAYPEDELSQILTWGLLLGVTTARHAPTVGTSGRVLPCPKFFNPATLAYDVLLGTWSVEDVNRQALPVTPNDGTWLLYTPYGNDRPWASGLWYSIALLAVAKCYAIQDWAKTSEKASMWVFESNLVDRDGYPITTTKDQRQNLVDALDARASDAAVALPAGWQLKLLQAADNYHIYLDQINMIDTAISVLIRGGNLSTQVTGGSLAAAQSQAETGDGAKVRKDSATLGTLLREQSINWWAGWNYGPGALAPWPKWEKKSPKTIDPSTATAVSAYTSAGFEVDVDLLRDEYGLDFLLSYEKPPPPPSPFGGGGGGGEEGEDGDPEAEAEGKPKPKGFGAHSHNHVHAAASESEGQRYIDRLHADVVNRSPLAVPAYDLLAVVNASASPEDLQRRLTEAYATMDRSTLEATFEQAFILAELAGRYAVLQGG